MEITTDQVTTDHLLNYSRSKLANSVAPSCTFFSVIGTDIIRHLSVTDEIILAIDPTAASQNSTVQ